MKILSINNFTTKLLSKLPSDLHIAVHLKGTRKFGSKVNKRPFFHRKTVFHMKLLSVINFISNLLRIIRLLFKWIPIERSLRSLRVLWVAQKIDLQAWRAFSIFKFTKLKSYDKIKNSIYI